VNGTLLTTDQQIHPAHLSAFLQLREKCPSLPIVLTSGSLYKRCQWMRDALKLPIHFPSMHCNGTLIYGGEKGELLKVYGVDPGAVEYVVENTGDYGCIIWKEHEGLLLNSGRGINAKDWVARLAELGKVVLDHTKDPQRKETLSAVREGRLTVIKVNVCADESVMEGSSSPLV
jgi:hydroxymethylpyrimidine pyrophosphatase-like HAD family hydrolase